MNGSEPATGSSPLLRVETDDHVFVKMDDGSIVREKRHVRNVVALIFFGILLAGLLLYLVLLAVGLFFRGEFDLICTMVAAAFTGIVGFVVFYTVRLMRQPPTCLDASARVLRMGQEEIPFERVSRISAPYRRLRSTRLYREGRGLIMVEFHDRKSIVLGSVTGAEASAERRIRAVLEMVGGLVGVPTEFEGILSQQKSS